MGTLLVDAIARESVILACIGFLIGGIDDLALDAVYWLGAVASSRPNPRVTDLAEGVAGRLAIFVPAWDEAAVIGRMLATTLARFGDDDFRTLCRRLCQRPRDDRRGGGRRRTRRAGAAGAQCARRGRRPRRTASTACGKRCGAKRMRKDGARIAVAFHDAEDVVHRDELRVYRALLRDYQVVQLPVMPLVDRALAARCRALYRRIRECPWTHAGRARLARRADAARGRRVRDRSGLARACRGGARRHAVRCRQPDRGLRARAAHRDAWRAPDFRASARCRRQADRGRRIFPQHACATPSGRRRGG